MSLDERAETRSRFAAEHLQALHRTAHEPVAPSALSARGAADLWHRAALVAQRSHRRGGGGRASGCGARTVAFLYSLLLASTHTLLCAVPARPARAAAGRISRQSFGRWRARHDGAATGRRACDPRLSLTHRRARAEGIFP